MEENKITDGETKEENVSKEKPSKRKRDFYIELALFLILGILLGIAVKTEAVKKVTIGFDDYRMKAAKQDYNIGELEKKLIEKSNEAEENNNSGSASVGEPQTGNEPSAEGTLVNENNPSVNNQ